MKKIFLAAVAIAAFASYNTYRSNNNETEGMSDTMLANVEALAGNEGFVDDGTCYHAIYTASGSQVRYCGTCTYIPNSAGEWGRSGKCW